MKKRAWTTPERAAGGERWKSTGARIALAAAAEEAEAAEEEEGKPGGATSRGFVRFTTRIGSGQYRLEPDRGRGAMRGANAEAEADAEASAAGADPERERVGAWAAE